MIDIISKSGAVRCSVEITAKCVYHKELQAEEYVLLSFDSDVLIPLAKGDYIRTEFGRFEIVNLAKPKHNVGTNGGYTYEQKFHAPWEKWKNRKMFYSRQKGFEKAWKMTNYPQYFLQILVDNLKAAGFGDWQFTFDASLTEMKLLSFDGTDLLAALTMIAEAWKTEWWITDNVIHLSRCEYGSAVRFEVGDIIADMSRGDSQDTDYYTRLYAFGSTRNLPANYRKDEGDNLVVEGVVERHLKLPQGVNYVDAWEGMAAEDIVEGIVVCDDIYPKRVGEIASVSMKEYTDTIENEDGTKTTVKWNAYRFKDSGITFSKEYMIEGEELRLQFQTGALAGMDFAVTFNPDAVAESSAAGQVFEIVRNEDYGIALPNDKYAPQAQDKYILYGYNTEFVSANLLPTAEAELYERAKVLVAKASQDKSVYECPTNPIRCAGYTTGEDGELTYLPTDVIDLDVGQAVELVSSHYFGSGSRVSRIQSFEKRLDNRYSCTYSVGETSSYSRSAALEEKIEELTFQTSQFVSNGGGVYIIKRHDGTAPSDHNVLSSLRSKAEFLHKQNPDIAKGLIKFLAGIETGRYEEGVEGGKFDDEGNLEAHTAFIRTLANIATAIVGQIGSDNFSDGFAGEGFQIWKAISTGDWQFTIDRLTVRKVMAVYELIIQKIRSVGGQLIISAGNGKIKKVETSGADYLITFEETNTFAEGDLMRCQTFNGADVKYYWVRISESNGDTITVPISEFNGVKPESGDDCVLMGNTDNPLRQSLISVSAAEDGQPRIDILNGVATKSFEGCLRARLGFLDDITDTAFPAENQPRGYGLYSDNVFLKGTFVLASNGESVSTLIEALDGRITTEISAIEKELRSYESYLRNAYFDKNMYGWETDNSKTTFFLAGNKWIWFNGAPLADKSSATGVTSDKGRTVLRIKNNYLRQKNANFESHPVCDETDIEGNFIPKQFYLSFYYRCVTPGNLKIEFENNDKTGFASFEMFGVNTELPATGEEYKTFEASGLWNGTGDFCLTFSGEIYIYALNLSLDRVADIEQRYKTFFEQTDKQLKLMAEAVAETTRSLETYHSEFVITAEAIRSEVSKSITDLENDLTEKLETGINQTAEQIQIIANRFNDDGSLKNTAGLITTSEMNNLYAFNSEGNIVSVISQTASDIKIKAQNISLEGLVTANGNFKILEDGSIETTNGKFEGEIKATSGSFGVLSFVDEIYDSSTGRVRFGSIDTSYTVISTSDEELGRNANIYLYNDVGVYGIVSTAKIALLAYGNVEVNGSVTASSLSLGGKKVKLVSQELFDGYDGEGTAFYKTITYLTLE